ncbi:hypothetical protein SUGI_0982400 [Cryptomeria japonica]|nr:hypothetical protein SUGI_0982400 [Cryptomeria japonica]
MGGSEDEKVYNVFVYGTLKKGFGNEWLTEQMIAQGHAELVGLARSREAYPLVCGPYEVPFLLHFPGRGRHVWGELYALDRHALEQFDHLEGTSKGHYSRRPIQIFRIDGENNEVEVDAEAYFAGDGYAHRLWSKTGVEKCLSCYSEEESRGYVRRNDRPPHLTFLQHIDVFLSTSAPPQHRQCPHPEVNHSAAIAISAPHSLFRSN